MHECMLAHMAVHTCLQAHLAVVSDEFIMEKMRCKQWHVQMKEGVVCQSKEHKGMVVRWPAPSGTLGHCWVCCNPRHLTEWSAFSMAFHINNLRVNAGHCGIFPSLWCLVGACSKSSLTPAGQVSRPHWPDSPGMESVSGRSKSPLWSCSLDHLTQTVQNDNRAQYNRGLNFQKCA